MSRRPGRRRFPGARWAAPALGTVLVCGGCGLPGPGSTRPVPADDVPYHLLDPAPTQQPRPSPTSARQATPQIFLLGDGGDLLVPVASSVDAGGLRDVLRQLLAQLAAGPTDEQRAGGLSSAFGPDARLELVDVLGTTVTVELSVPRDPAADRLALAVGQVVLSLTSVAGVEGVRFVRDGEVREVPLPGGSRTAGVVRGQDYEPLTVGGSVPSTKADPSPRPSAEPVEPGPDLVP